MPGYKVTDSRELSGMTQAGGERRYYRVWIRTERGATGYVDVLPDKWNENDLPGILADKAAELDLAFSLTS